MCYSLPAAKGHTSDLRTNGLISSTCLRSVLWSVVSIMSYTLSLDHSKTMIFTLRYRTKVTTYHPTVYLRPRICVRLTSQDNRHTLIGRESEYHFRNIATHAVDAFLRYLALLWGMRSFSTGDCRVNTYSSGRLRAQRCGDAMRCITGIDIWLPTFPLASAFRTHLLSRILLRGCSQDRMDRC